MKPSLLSLSTLALAAASAAAMAQTAAKTAPHAAGTHTAATSARTSAHAGASGPSAAKGGCIQEPALSPKIPATPAGACPKALYTITTRPPVMLEYASPMVSPALMEFLNAAPVSVTLGYIDTKIGTGELAQPHKFYTVHYTGYLTDGTKFDSSVDRGEPITFPYGQHRVILGWDTGFEGMHVGGKRRLFVPYQLAYGEAGKPPAIPAKSELIFDVELVGQSDTPPAPKAPSPSPASSAPAGASAQPGAPAEHPATQPTGAAGTPPVNSSTPASSTQPASKPEGR